MHTNNNHFWDNAIKALSLSINTIYTVIAGIVMTFVQYIFPVHNIVQLVVAFFILDVGVGYYAAKKLRKERFSPKIIWEHTVPRMTISLLLIICSYTWDEVFKQEFVSTYNIVGWFIAGVLLSSIADNGYQVTKWGAFQRLNKTLVDKINKQFDKDSEDEAKG